MDQGPLVIEEIDAAAKLIRAFDAFRPIKVAFWLKASDEDQRYVYIASDAIDDSNFGDAYREIVKLENQKPTAHLDLFRVKVIPGNNPLAEAALDITARFPTALATRLHGGRFGGLTVDDVYIYPPLAAAVP